MINLYAQPYNIDATGFYFETLAAYEAKSANLLDAYGNIVEEFEIQFIDGDNIQGALANAMNLSQANMGRYLELLDEEDEYELTKLVIGLNEGIDLADIDTDQINIYEADTLADLAEQFIDEGLYGDVPTNLRGYLDTDAMGRDLGHNGYCSVTVAGKRLIYSMD